MSHSLPGAHLLGINSRFLCHGDKETASSATPFHKGLFHCNIPTLTVAVGSLSQKATLIETFHIKDIRVQQQWMTTVLEQDHCSSDFLCTQLTFKTTILAVVMLSTAVLEMWPSGPDELFDGMEP